MTVTLLKNKNLLTILGNSIKGGDNFLFRNLIVRQENGEEKDLLEDGKNSCAAFVSWILLTLELIKKPHATVDSTIKDLLATGWYQIDEYREGAVLVWEKLMAGDGISHGHIGFYVGNNEAISNDSRGRGFPHKHNFNYGGTRKIEKIYWHPDLDIG